MGDYLCNINVKDYNNEAMMKKSQLFILEQDTLLNSIQMRIVG